MKRLAPALSRLENDFRIVVADDIGRKSGFLAGDDERRAAEFNAALRDPDVRCIWAARGGYGCSRMAALLDQDAMRADPVPIVGFSDLTVLLSWAATLGYRSIHGPVLTQFAELNDFDQHWMTSLLLGDPRMPAFAHNLKTSSPDQVVEGKLIGGNLSLLAHLCGTPWALRFDDALCVLEDVGERPYAIDRYLQQLLLQPGPSSLRAASAVLLGDFTSCEEAGDPSLDPVQGAVDRLQEEKLLCASGLPLGHGSRNRAFPFGARARLEGEALWLLESAVEQ